MLSITITVYDNRAINRGKLLKITHLLLFTWMEVHIQLLHLHSTAFMFHRNIQQTGSQSSPLELCSLTKTYSLMATC